jgi:N-acetylmuramoyl-L-alanine amidase
VARRKKSKSTTHRTQGGCNVGLILLAIIVLAGVYALYQVSLNLDENGHTDGFWNVVSGLFGSKPRVGLVAGHWQNDSGAVCPDGPKEVDINLDVAERTAGLLRRAGYRVDLLAEFDPLLEGYEADVFLSIHSDSCIYGVSGFKLARLPDSQVGEQADRLVEALYREYEEVTGLEPHYHTITYDMSDYHAFHEISPETPGAIIEIGFMGEDQDVLTRRSDLVARGIARGIIAYLQEESEREAD